MRQETWREKVLFNPQRGKKKRQWLYNLPKVTQ